MKENTHNQKTNKKENSMVKEMNELIESCIDIEGINKLIEEGGEKLEMVVKILSKVKR